MDLANFLWVPRGVAIKADFARTVQDVFQTRVRDADFSRSELVRQLVNRRISNMTRGHIQELLPQGCKLPASYTGSYLELVLVVEKLSKYKIYDSWLMNRAKQPHRSSIWMLEMSFPNLGSEYNFRLME